MSVSHEREPWLERHGLWLVILYGILFVTTIVSFNPTR